MGKRELKRIGRLRSLMGKDDCDCFLLSNPASIRYFTGFKAHDGCGLVFVPFEEKPVIVSDLRYKTQIEEEVDSESFDVLMVANSGQSPYLEKLAEVSPLLLQDFGQRLRVEDRHLSMNQYLEIKKLWPKVCILPRSLLIYNIRSVKDADEIALIRKAIRITERALEETASVFKVGTTEKEIAAEITYRQKKLGADADGFPLIVLSGERMALVHGEPGTRAIKDSDLLQFDIGCVCDGYHSDISRVFSLGYRKPTEKQCEIYDFLVAVQNGIIGKIKPGVNFKDLNLEYKELLREKGFEAQHSLGHGVGLEIHEWPNLNDQDFIAEPGNVVTVEPGIYIPGWGGMRVEDMVLVTETGHEVLTSFRR